MRPRLLDSSLARGKMPGRASFAYTEFQLSRFSSRAVAPTLKNGEVEESHLR